MTPEPRLLAPTPTDSNASVDASRAEGEGIGGAAGIAGSKRIDGITLDLDDTLWPVWPTIQRAEAELHAWIATNARATAARFDVAAMRALRETIVARNPGWAHDLTRLRCETLRHAFTSAGDDPAQVEPAFAVFFAARNRVELFVDALPALEALARRWPIVALTNGNADLHGIGLAHHFTAVVTARDVGVAKPDARIFHAACRGLGAAPDRVLHIGDDWALDVLGARAAGMRAAWVRREGARSAPADGAGADFVTRDLLELVAQLEA